MNDISTYTVAGMTCGHCVTSVTEEVRAIPGVQEVDVMLETGTLTVSSDKGIDDRAMRDAVHEAGYQLA